MNDTKTHSFWYKYRYFLYLIPIIFIGVNPPKIEDIMAKIITVFELNNNNKQISDMFILREAIYINIFGTLLFIASTSTRFFDSIIKKFSSTNHKNNQILLFQSFSVISVGFVIALSLSVYTKLNYPAHKDIMMLIQNSGDKFIENVSQNEQINFTEVLKLLYEGEILDKDVIQKRQNTYQFLTFIINFLTVSSIYLLIVIILILFIFEPVSLIFITGYKDIYQRKIPNPQPNWPDV